MIFVIHLAANISAAIFFCNVEFPCKIRVIHTESQLMSQKFDRSLYTQNAVEVTAPLHIVASTSFLYMHALNSPLNGFCSRTYILYWRHAVNTWSLRTGAGGTSLTYECLEMILFNMSGYVGAVFCISVTWVTHMHAHTLVRLPRYFCSLLWVSEWLHGTESCSLLLHSYASPYIHTNVFPSKHVPTHTHKSIPIFAYHFSFFGL